MAMPSNHLAYSPAEAIELVSRAGVKKGNMRPDKIFLSAVSAGCLLNFGSGAMLIALASPWYQENAPGLIRIIGAFVFPFGFDMVILTGVDLFTASTMFTVVPVLQRRLKLWKMLLHWFLCFVGNFMGALFLMAIICGYGEVFHSDPYQETVIAFVTKKQLVPTFHQIFLRAIGCNWLVCLACYLSMMAKDVTSKVFSIWWPIVAFVSLGLDHVVANMFLIPMGIFLHTPGVSVGLYIWKGVIPATLGNILGGALFCGTFYWWMYVCMEPPIHVGDTPCPEAVRETSAGFPKNGGRMLPVDEENQQK